MADKTWIICELCQGSGQYTYRPSVGEDGELGDPITITCPKCNGEKIVIRSVIEGTVEDARKEFGLGE